MIILLIISIILLIVAILYRILSVSLSPYAFIDFLFAVQIVLLFAVLGIFIRMIINILFEI